MSSHRPIRLGIVGACGRGGSFKSACEALGSFVVQAVCDINADKLPEAAARLGARECYTDYETMLRQSAVDAVIIGTPMPLHVPQSILALESGRHVLSEVPAGVSIHECRDLVRVCRRSGAVYMMAENYTYMQPNVIVRTIYSRIEGPERDHPMATHMADGHQRHHVRNPQPGADPPMDAGRSGRRRLLRRLRPRGWTVRCWPNAICPPCQPAIHCRRRTVASGP